MIRIAQISDFHLRHHLPGTSACNPRRSRAMPDLLREALRQIRQQEPDLLAVTGDLVDAPVAMIDPTAGFELDQPAFWAEAVEKDYRLVRQLLDDSGLRYTVLPGNHDLEEAMWRVFDPTENVLDVAGHRVVRFCDREHVGHLPRRFLHQRLLWEEMLADPESPPQIHLQHYVITPTLNNGYPHTYAEGEELTRRMVASRRVRLSLSGHYHAGTELLTFGGTTFATSPGFCQSPYTWRLYEIDDQGQTVMSQHSLGRSHLPQRRAVFLDRDGVINDLASYCGGVELMRLLPGVGRAIRRLNGAGYAVAVLTNQCGVGLGYYPESVVISVHDKMMRLLSEEGATLDGIYFSRGASDRACLPQYIPNADQKPSPTHIFQAREELNLNLDGGWMVGDRPSDMATARNAGVRPILVRTGHGYMHEAEVRAEHDSVAVVDDLPAAVDLILGDEA